MSKTEKPSFLTRAMQNVDRKMGRTPAEGETTTPESRTEIKQALIGAGVVIATGAALIYGMTRFVAKAAIEEEESTSTETTED